MKGVKVIIAAAAVAFMFMLVPFASASSDADWGPNEEKSVYFESDSDKITWDKYKEVSGKTDEDIAKMMLYASGYEVNSNTYDYSGYEFSNLTLKGGRAGALKDKTNIWENTTVISYDFKFTISATAVEKALFRDGMSQQMTDLYTYLGLEDGKLKVNDKLELSGSFSAESANKSIHKYKDVDETFAAIYYNEYNQINNMSLTLTVKFIRGDVTKEYGHEGSSLSSKSETTSYEMDDDEKTVSKDKLYVKTVTKSETANGTFSVKYDNKEIAPTPTATLNSDNGVSYEEGSKISGSYISDIKVNPDDITYKIWLDSPLSETDVKNKLEGMGKTTSEFSDVDAVCEGLINPPEPEETPVNQGLFFGAFIFIFVVVIVIAVVLREKNKQ